MDREIETAVFTHRGIDSVCNYERYEWLGDAYLEMIATVLIFRTFSDTAAGRCSQIREQLVRNSTLSEYYRLYKMERRSRFPREVDQLRSKELSKIQGDIFEAYVAGVVLSDPVNGVSTVTAWLKALWGRTIKDQIRKNEEAMTFNVAKTADPAGASSGDGKKNLQPKERLAQMIVVRGIRLRYEDIPGAKKDKNLGLPLFSVGVYLDGWGETNKLLGWGTALGKKEAGQKAATMAMENKKLIQHYDGLKKEFQAAQQKGQEAAQKMAGDGTK